MAPDQFGRTILYGAAFVNRAGSVAGALKALEKARKYHGDVIRSRFVRRPPGFKILNAKYPICAWYEIYC
jgi:hypothetical protein